VCPAPSTDYTAELCRLMAMKEGRRLVSLLSDSKRAHTKVRCTCTGNFTTWATCKLSTCELHNAPS
jgi:hypothetical protein